MMRRIYMTQKFHSIMLWVLQCFVKVFQSWRAAVDIKSIVGYWPSAGHGPVVWPRGAEAGEAGGGAEAAARLDQSQLSIAPRWPMRGQYYLDPARAQVSVAVRRPPRRRRVRGVLVSGKIFSPCWPDTTDPLLSEPPVNTGASPPVLGVNITTHWQEGLAVSANS